MIVGAECYGQAYALYQTCFGLNLPSVTKPDIIDKTSALRTFTASP
jgi:hypothetical protein